MTYSPAKKCQYSYSHTGSKKGTICLLTVHLPKDLLYGNNYLNCQ